MDGKRIMAFIIDYLITAGINAILFMIFIMYPLITKPADVTYPVMLRSFVYTGIAWLYLLIRDIPPCGSIGKLIMKQRIVSADTNAPAVLWQRIVRNLTWILGPVEILVYLIAKKRLGDMLARTTVATLEDNRKNV